MKKILLSLFAAILATGAFLDTKNYIQGNNIELNSYDPAGSYQTKQEAVDEMGYALELIDVDSHAEMKRIFKLPNKSYYTLEMLDAQKNQSSYLYTGLIETQNGNTSILEFPEHKWELISVNNDYKNKSWDVNSKAGKFHFNVGDFVSNDIDNRIIINDDESAGMSIDYTPKKGVIEMNDNGVWLDHAKFKVGMQNKSKTYPTEDAAVNAVKQNDFGKRLGVIKMRDMNFYVYVNQVAEFNEYTIVPVRLKDNQFIAGKYERFTFESEDIFEVSMEEQVEGILFTVHFQQDNEKLKKYSNTLKHKHMHIAVVGGKQDAK
ncbi:hypothetical protein ACMGE5_05170 [Macrococcus equi]|uniref:hypothetical protein n=1 Tax=Macrococcus equi TaxID=3395462 RepID=UPI0039BE5CAB